MISPARGDYTFRAAIACAMVGCLALSAVSFIGMLARGWDDTFVVLIPIGVAVEAFAAHAVFHRGGPERGGTLRLTIVELAAMYFALQLCVDARMGNQPFHEGFPHLDGATLGLFVPSFLIWLVCSDTARDFDRIEALHQGSLGYVPPERHLSTRVFVGGVVLFILAGLTQVHIARALKLPVPDTSGPLGNVLLYFLLGIVLLGHVHYAVLRGRWQRNDIAMAHGLGASWIGYSIGFVSLVAAIAFLLPTTGTLGLLDVGRAIWDPIAQVLIQIILAIRGPLTGLLRFFGGNAPVARPRVLPRLPPHVHLPPKHHSNLGHGGASNAVTVLKSLLFWLAAAVAVVYVVRHATPTRLRRVPMIGGLLSAVRGAIGGFLAVVRRRLSGYARHALEHVPGTSALHAMPAIFPSGRLTTGRIGTLSPREQVLYYYLNVVRRAHRRGVDRRDSQTPYEFSKALAPHVSEAEGDLRQLTEAFMEARYSGHDITPAAGGSLRANWQRVKAALRVRGKHGANGTERTGDPSQ